MKAKRKHKKSIIVRVIVLGVSVYMVATLMGLWSELNESRATLAKLQQQRDTEQLRIEELKELLESGSYNDIIEKAARERLGFVYSDEEIYIDISGN